MKNLNLKPIRRLVLQGNLLIFICSGLSGQDTWDERGLPKEENHTEKTETGSEGMFYLSDPVDYTINNLGSKQYTLSPGGDLPEGAVVTRIVYAILIDDNGDESTFWPAQYNIRFNASLNPGHWNSYYYHHGDGHLDDNYDDDDANDTDISIGNREISAFNGESADQTFTLHVQDDFAAVSVCIIKNAYLAVYWEAPVPNLTANETFPGWVAPVQTNSSASHGQASVLYANSSTYIGTSLSNDSEYDCTEPFLFIIKVDGTSIALFGHDYLNSHSPFSRLTEHTFTAGSHTICQVVDPLDGVDETDESDNQYCKTFTWVGPPVAPALSSPSNEATCQLTYFTFSWSASAYATGYILQVDDNSDYSSPVIDMAVSGTSQYVAGLNTNKKYYWRVRGTNPAGNGSFSSSRSFTTALTTPSTPALSSPSEGASCQPVSLTLDWNDASNASTYTVQVDNNSDFSSPLINQAGLGTSQYAASGLSGSTTYYWRVRGVNSCSESSWSSSRNFSTSGAPSTPSLSGPANSATCQSTSLTLSWNSVSGASTYDVKVDNNSDFSSPEVNRTEVSGTSTSVSGLSQGTTYYWLVRAKNSCGNYSSWSDSRSFSTTASAPAAPAPSSPSEGSGCQPLTVTIGWGSVSSASVYSLQVDNNSDFSSPVFNQGSIASTSQPVSGLSEGTTYYWRIRAANSCGVESSWSSARSFSTLISSLGTPSLSGPDDNAECQPVNPALSWTGVANATGYSLQVDNNSDFGSPEYSQDCEGTNHNCSSLSESTLYYWRVKATGNCDVAGSWSGARSFETGSGGMAVPSLTGPADNSTEQPISITLTWDEVEGATIYRFQLDNNEDFASPVYAEELTANSKDISALSEGTVYFWQVQAIGDCSSGEWSEVWQFTTSGEAPDALTGAESMAYSLEQNYPNPFMETTMIEFSIPSDGYVSIEILDLQGKIVGNYSGYYCAGNHSMEIRLGAAMQAGVYLYRMRTQGFIDTRLCVVR